MKYNNYKKLSIICVLLFALIYILYIDNNLHENILSNNILNIKENFSNYVNVCKNGEVPQFYNLISIGTTRVTLDTASCSAFCDNSNNCIMYTLKDNECKLYGTQTDINVQCANSKDTIINESNYTYNGVGYVKNKYYDENASNFKHIDYILNKANTIKTSFNEVKSHIDNITYQDDKNAEILNEYNNIHNVMKDISGYYKDDTNYINSYNNLFTFLLPKSELYNIPELSMNFRDEKYNFKDFYNSFDKLFKSNNSNDAKIESSNLEYNRRYLVYISLSFLLVITLLLLIFYIFAPNIISNIFMFFYFIGIILLTFFVHLILKQ